MDTHHELRLELAAAGDELIHVSLFCTDRDGQWFLLDDWTAETRQDAAVVTAEALGMVDTWLQHGGRLIPA